MTFRIRPLSSGSSGNCLVARTASTTLLVDVGVTEVASRALFERADVAPASVAAIVLTHAHGDHIGSACKLSRAFKLPLHASEEAARATPVLSRLKRLVRFRPGEAFAIGDVRVETVALSHDAPGTVAVVLEAEGFRFAIATDLGRGTPELEAALAGCDAFLLEFNHDETALRDGPYPWRLKRRVLGEEGHLSNEQAAAILRRAVGPRLRDVYVGHLSEWNNSPEQALAAARRALALAGRADVRVHLAPRGEPGPALVLGAG